MGAGKLALLIFLAVAALLAPLNGNRFLLTNDEGILLDPAQQMAAGARPYVDFFGYMSPGSYWLQAALFKLFGVSLWVARIPVILSFSLQCALLFWLTDRLAARRAAAAVLAIFFGFQIADPAFLTAQHRWDSAALAFAGICVAVKFAEPGAKWGFAASGALLGAAAWCTPSIAVVGVAQAAWLAWFPERRRLLIPFAAGAGAISVLACGGLALQGSLGAFVHQVMWLQHNYAEVNVMSYGAVIGGYGRLLDGAAGALGVVQVVVVLCLTLPAILPFVAAVLWAFAFFRKQVSAELRPLVLLLLLDVAALVASTFPRADLMHLNFVAALSYALTAAALARLLPRRAGVVLSFAFIPCATLFALNGLTGWLTTRPVSSPVGSIRVARDLAPEVQKLLARVHPSDGLFVYPYMPVHYFITQARNSTRFSFLAPGMMKGTEEAEVLSELKARPPRWLLYMPLTREEFLRVFPNARNLNYRFETLESWLEKNYEPVEPEVNVGGYRLWREN